MFWGWGAEDDDMSKRMSSHYFHFINLCVFKMPSYPINTFNLITILSGIRYHKFNITRYKANIARLLKTNLCLI